MPKEELILQPFIYDLQRISEKLPKIPLHFIYSYFGQKYGFTRQDTRFLLKRLREQGLIKLRGYQFVEVVKDG
ncbi:MAG: hypothetical protein QXM68_02140 [Candidatus Aenigmatarchaeota archaeon]|nr:hypothetical protein [Candidatus Aenigmarchaeota archaeon]